MTEEWCKHEMPTSWCGTCRPRPGAIDAPVDKVVVQRRFTARWRGACSNCPVWFDEGDEIGVVDGEYICPGCCA